MHLLSAHEASALLSVLALGDEEEEGSTTFGGVAAHFVQVFPANARFKACCAAVLLLEEDKVLSLKQRLVLWYLLWDAYKSGPLDDNPFASFFVEALVDEASKQERDLLSKLLHSETLQQLSAQAIDRYIADGDQAAVSLADLQDFRNRFSDRHEEAGPRLSAFTAAGLTRVLVDEREQSRAGVDGGDNGDVRGAAAELTSSLSIHGFEPPWIRPQPRLLPPCLNELQWLPADVPQGLLWDVGMLEDNSHVPLVKELISKALKGPLLPAQQHQVLDHLEADPKLAFKVGLTPQQLPDLVEHTPVIAYEILLKLMGSTAINEYFHVLANMDMSLHSMEVVNRLTSAVSLSAEFVHLYITNCINSCEGIQDKYMQNRLVRLLCVFLQSLIRNKFINIQDLLHEVQTFCINFSRIREAASLFRLLKQLESGNKSAEGSVDNLGNSVVSDFGAETSGASVLLPYPNSKGSELEGLHESSTLCPPDTAIHASTSQL